MANNRLELPSEEELDKLLSEDIDGTQEETSEESISEDTSSTETQSTEQDSDEDNSNNELEEKVERLEMLIRQQQEMMESNKQPIQETTESLNSVMEGIGEMSEEDLDELPESVRERLKAFDKMNGQMKQLQEQREQDEVRQRADGYVRDLDALAEKHPALKDKNVRYATLMYAANGLNDTSKQGFSRAFKTLSKSFGTNTKKVDVKKAVKVAKKQKESVPKVGKGGVPSLTTDNTPKTLAEATDMAAEFLKQL